MSCCAFGQAAGCLRYLASALWLSLWSLPVPVPALGATENTDFDPAFRTDARFVIGDEVHTAVSAVAWIEPHFSFAGSRHLIVGFYPFPLTRQQTTAAAAGNYGPIEDRVKADSLSADHKSHVRVLLTLYEGSKVGFADITVPGSLCTVTPLQNQVPGFLQVYRFEGGRLRLKSRGSHACFAMFPEIPDKTYQWDFDVDLPVFEFGSQ